MGESAKHWPLDICFPDYNEIPAVFSIRQRNKFFLVSEKKIGSMNIPVNENAPVKSKSRIEINAPIGTVWKVLTDIHNWKKWQKAVTQIIVHGEIREGTKFDWKAGGLSFKSEIHTVKPLLMFGWTGTTIGTSAIHNWTFEEKENNTIVTVEESLRGLFPGLFRAYFQKNLDMGVITSLEELKAASEAV